MRSFNPNFATRLDSVNNRRFPFQRHWTTKYIENVIRPLYLFVDLLIISGFVEHLTVTLNGDASSVYPINVGVQTRIIIT